MQLVESRQSYSFSVLLHAGLLLFAMFGLPQLLSKRPDPMPLVMTVDILPITGVTNVKPSDEPIQEEKKAKAATAKKTLPPAAKEPPKPEAKPAEVEPAPKPVEKAEAKPDKPKPVEKTEEKTKKSDDFAALLNKLQQEADANKKAKDTTSTEANKTKSDAPYDPTVPMSLSEKDAIRSQFIPCWRMPIGAKDPQSLAARIHLTLQADGTVLTAELADDQRNRYVADPFFKAAADAALRAVHQCSPLKNLPPDKYNSWRDMELNFDPSALM